MSYSNLPLAYFHMIILVHMPLQITLELAQSYPMQTKSDQ
jgi:hypothetical protein